MAYDKNQLFARGLRRAMDRLGWTHEDLAKRLGVSRVAVTNYLSGKNAPKGARLEEIARVVGVTVADLFEPGPDDGNTVPVVGYVGAGTEVFPIDEGDLGTGLEHVPSPPGADDTLVAVIVRGNSMLPVFWEGDLLYYTRSSMLDREECLYRECVVKVVDGPTYVKHVMPGRSGGLFTLTSYNASPILDVELEWAAPVQYHDMRRRKVGTGVKVLSRPQRKARG